MHPVTFTDVLHARQRLGLYLKRTPLHTYPALNAFLGIQIYINTKIFSP